MLENQHPLAPEHLPVFIPGADGSDPLYTAVATLLVILVLSVGIIYLRLHALPEHLAHRTSSTQLQLITVLALLALFTHNNAFWILALLLAVVRIPDFLTPLKSISESLKKTDNSTPATEPAVEPESPGQAAQHSARSEK